MPLAVGVIVMLSSEVAVNPEPVDGVADHCTEYPEPALLTLACNVALLPRQICSAVADREISGVLPIMTFTEAVDEQLFSSVTVTEYNEASVMLGVTKVCSVELFDHK